MELTDQQAKALNEASLDLLQTSIDTVGIDATVQLVKTLTGVIADEPGLAKKLANPAVQEKLAKMSEEYKAKFKGKKKPSMMEVFRLMGPLMAQLKEIFD